MKIDNIHSVWTLVKISHISLSILFIVQTADNSHCAVSPASAFAIATAAAGHGSPPGEKSLPKIIPNIKIFSEGKYFLGIYLNPKQPLICYYNLHGVFLSWFHLRPMWNICNLTPLIWRFFLKLFRNHCLYERQKLQYWRN